MWGVSGWPKCMGGVSGWAPHRKCMEETMIFKTIDPSHRKCKGKPQFLKCHISWFVGAILLKLGGVTTDTQTYK